MLVLTHHTGRTAEAQLTLVEDTWTIEVVPRLPADLTAQARTHNAFQRVRGLSTPVDLLRAVLASSRRSREASRCSTAGVKATLGCAIGSST